VCSEEVGLDFVVEDEDESTTSSSDDVGEGSLEEGFCALLLVDLDEAVRGASVHELGLWETRLHHQSSTDGVEWVRDNTGGDSDNLSESPSGEEVGLLGVWEEDRLASVEHTEVGGTVGDDTDDRDSETSVESFWAVGLAHLNEAVNETGELTILAGTNISGETGSRKVEWVDEAEGSSTGSTTRGAVSEKELDWLLLGVVWVQVLLVEVLASEVEGLGWEVTNDVCQVSSPEGANTLLSQDTSEAVTNTVVSLVSSHFLVSVLNLEQELNTLNWGNESLGDCCGDTTDHEIGEHTFLSFRGSLCHLTRMYYLLIITLSKKSDVNKKPKPLDR
jgi:hypothetical protein